MKISALIVEDNLNAVEILEKILHQFPDINVIGTSTTKEDAISKITHFKPDLLFLDIQLGNHISFEILNETKGMYKFIIFITAYESYALKAYEYNTIHYILKPIVKEDITIAFQKIKHIKLCNAQTSEDDLNLLNTALHSEINANESESSDKFFYYAGKQWKSINRNEIIYLFGEGSYTTIFTSTTNIKVSKNLKTTGDDFLKLPHFIRVQKKFIVNTNFIQSVTRGLKPKLILTNQVEIPVSLMLKDKVFGKIGVKKYQKKI